MNNGGKTLPEIWKSFYIFKNYLLLRNMIYLLNANMIGSTDVEHDIFDFVKSDYSV